MDGMKEIKMVVNGVEINAVMFKTRKAAEKYRKNNMKSEYIFIKSGQYYVSK